MIPPMHLTITSLYAGILAILLVILSVAVTAGRAKFKVDYGDGGNMTLMRRIRAQGNLAEYAPMALILMALLELGGTIGWLLHTLGIALILARLLHVYATYTETKVGLGRTGSTTVTWLILVVGGVLVIGMTQGMMVK
jgi:hypothetical protein